MSDKKPVWVDESAHAILKEYAKLTKEPMVEVASRLVLDHLGDLDPNAGLSAASEPRAAAIPAPEPNKRASLATPAAPPRPRPTRTELDGTRFLGGVWLV
jgi:hypothetical protein